jgi:hypothetical protein
MTLLMVSTVLTAWCAGCSIGLLLRFVSRVCAGSVATATAGYWMWHHFLWTVSGMLAAAPLLMELPTVATVLIGWLGGVWCVAALWSALAMMNADSGDGRAGWDDDGGGGGSGPNDDSDGDGPDGEPSWWPEFERELRAWDRARTVTPASVS